MIKKLLTLCFLVMVIPPVDLMCQKLLVKKYSSKDGLIPRSIKLLIVDEKGELWLTTDHELISFNGYAFNYQKEINNLIEGSITSITCDNKNVIWLAANKSLIMKDQGIVKKWQFQNKVDNVVFVENGIAFSSDHQVYVLDTTELLKLKSDQIMLKDIEAKYIFEEDIYDMQYWSGNGILVSELLRTSLIKKDSIINPLFYHLDKRPPAAYNFINQNQFHFSQKSNGLVFVKNQNSKYHVSNLIHKDYAVYYDTSSEGNIHVSYNYLVYQNDSINLQTDHGVDLVNTVTKDKKGNLWIGCNIGLLKVSRNNFTHIKIPSLLNNYISAINWDEEGNALLGSNPGYVYTVEHDEAVEGAFGKMVDVAEVVGVHKSQTDLWIVTSYFGVKHFFGNQTSRIFYDDPAFPYDDNPYINGLTEGADIYISKFINSHLYLGHSHGVSSISYDSISKQYEILNSHEQAVKMTSPIIDIALRPDNALFFLAKDKVFISETGQLSNLTQLKATQHSSNQSCIAVDNDGKCFIGTLGDGIFRYIMENDSLILINHHLTENGLSSNYVLNVLQDDEDSYWFSDYTSINQLRYEKKKILLQSYSATEGWFDDVYQFTVLEENKEGQIWAGCNLGVLYFNPHNLDTSQQFLTPEITEVKVNGIVNSDLFQQALAHDQNNIEFTFLANNINAPHKTIYAYKLEGLESNWVYGAQSRKVLYHDLRPGKYGFNVKCSNKDGLWYELASPFTFTIQKPFYKSNWFYLIVSTVLFTTVLLIILIRDRQTRKVAYEKNKINIQIANLRTQAIQSQMNPHFIFNSMNAIQETILQNQISNAYRYLSTFSVLLRKTLDASRGSKIRIDEEAEMLNMYLELESLRFDENFNYEVVVEDEVEFLEIPCLMIQPLVENALWHGLMHKQKSEPKLIQINFSSDEEHIVISVYDNGIGRAKSGSQDQVKFKKKSIAITNITERLNIISERTNKTASIKYTDHINPSGTTATLRLPMDNFNNIVSI